MSNFLLKKNAYFTGLIIIILISIFIYIYLVNNVGDARIVANQFNIYYTIDNNKKIYTGDNIIKNLPVGQHKIYTREFVNNNYVTKSFDINIKRDETIYLEIFLEPTKTNPDVSGEEYGF